jgi:sulfide:quinone oxidoreductase
VARTVILGGGFGGLAAAHELRTRHPDVEVVLVDQGNRFFMGFAKLWDLAGSRPLAEGTRRLDELTDRGIHVHQVEVTGIDPEQHAVDTAEGRIEGDGLLVALGATASPAHRARLDGPHAHDLYDAAALTDMHRDLDDVDDGLVLVAILGGPLKCPPAPYEAVLLVDERLRTRGVRDRVRVAISTPMSMTLPVAGPDASRYVAAHLAERDIELLDSAKVTEIDGGEVTYEDGSTLEATVILGVPASVPPPLLSRSGLTGPSGWIEPDRHTLRTGVERVYAVGDCTQIPTVTAQLPKAGVIAAGQGAVAARNLAADLLGGDGDRFDGHGYCFLELPGERVAFVEGDFYAEPVPDVTLTEADTEHYERKQRYETDLLAAWFG